MRYRLMRLDIWLCLLLAYLAALGTGKLTVLLTATTYDSYVEAHTIQDGQVGGRAGPEVPRAQSVEDLLSLDTFTVESPGIEYRNRGAGYGDEGYFYMLTLPSGELVAALINEDAVQTDGFRDEDWINYYQGTTVLPVGRVVWKDLRADTRLIGQIEYSEPLTRTDFYLDMCNGGGTASKEHYSTRYEAMVQVLTVFLLFPLLHYAGSHLGVLPYLIPPRKKEGKEPQKSEWD